MKVKNIRIVVLLLMMSLTTVISSCTNKLTTNSKVSKTQIYLQSVSKEQTDSNYGLDVENPIILKLSQELVYESIINEYIKRLTTNGERGLQSLKIIDKSKITLPKGLTDSNSNFENCIYSYKIVSDDGSFNETLYFKLEPKANKFYIPKGFIYGSLSD